jgi:CDP-diacylglycerol--glycerol-3-phosphate 3-phosphatidyltransferase
VFTTRFQAWVRRNALKLAGLLAALPITPNMVTVAGMLVTFAAATLAGLSQLRWAGIVLAFAGTFDILDGALARAKNLSYPYGAFLDSTTDRYSEGATYLGIAAFLLWHGGDRWSRWGVLACVVALSGSFLVSYVRARAQSLGFRCDGGLFARPERVVVTVIGLIIANVDVLVALVIVIAVVTNFTALQRIWEVWRQARAQRRLEEHEAESGPAEAAQAGPGPEQPKRRLRRWRPSGSG